MRIHIGDGVCKKTERGERRLVERGFERKGREGIRRGKGNRGRRSGEWQLRRFIEEGRGG